MEWFDGINLIWRWAAVFGNQLIYFMLQLRMYSLINRQRSRNKRVEIDIHVNYKLDQKNIPPIYPPSASYQGQKQKMVYASKLKANNDLKGLFYCSFYQYNQYNS